VTLSQSWNFPCLENAYLTMWSFRPGCISKIHHHGFSAKAESKLIEVNTLELHESLSAQICGSIASKSQIYIKCDHQRIEMVTFPETMQSDQSHLTRTPMS
jgi:hypothetical protein